MASQNRNRFEPLSEMSDGENQGFESNDDERQLDELLKDAAVASATLNTQLLPVSLPSAPSTPSASGNIRPWVAEGSWTKRRTAGSEVRRGQQPVSSPPCQSSSMARPERRGMELVNRKSGEFDQAGPSSAVRERSNKPQWPLPAPQVQLSDIDPDMKRGAIINDAHWSKYAHIDGWNCDEADLVTHRDCGKGIVKKRYMVVWKLLHQRLLCFPVTSHNKEGIRDLAPDDRWYHVSLKFASNVGTNDLNNLGPWRVLRYTMFGQEGQLHVRSHIAIGDLYCLKIGNDVPKVLGALTAESVGDLEDIFDIVHGSGRMRMTGEEGV